VAAAHLMEPIILESLADLAAAVTLVLDMAAQEILLQQLHHKATTAVVAIPAAALVEEVALAV
jgi:hypothetical protein